MADENENNLVQRAREDRRTLERMRRKLATSGQIGKNDVIKLKKTKKSIRIWPFAAVLAALLIGFNVFLHTQQDRIAAAMGGAQAPTKAPLAPPAGASMDDQARFWAYAAFDIAKLKARFPIPKGATIDAAGARANLERVLAENLGREVRNEIFIMQQNAPPLPVTKTKIGGTQKPSE